METPVEPAQPAPIVKKSPIVPLVLILISIVILVIGFIFLIKSRKTTNLPVLPNNILPTIQPTQTVVSKVTESAFVLTVSSPINGSTVTDPKITVKGITLPEAEVFINDKETIADDQGNFSLKLTLDEGENIINIVANDEGGNSVEKELTITYLIEE